MANALIGYLKAIGEIESSSDCMIGVGWMISAVWRTALLLPLSAARTVGTLWSWLDGLDPGFGPGLSLCCAKQFR